MSKFNSTKQKETHVENQAGGSAYKQSTKLAIASLLLTSFVSGSHYETEAEETKRLKQLFEDLPKEDKIFMGKAAIYARDKFRMRSITHLVSSLIAQKVVDEPWAKRFFSKVVMRVDDMSEAIACYLTETGKGNIPSSMIKGYKKAFNKFDGYNLAKYQSKGKEVSLIDVVRLVHPKGTEKNAKALNDLVYSRLKCTETWEAKKAEAGKIKDVKEKTAAVKKSWADMVAKGDAVEYLALLKNIRNIVQEADQDTILKALALLTDSSLIKKSKVFPFRFITAINELYGNPNVVRALSTALEKSMSNCPTFSGNTAVFLDISGSMGGRPFEIAKTFAAVLFKANNVGLSNCKVILFNRGAGELTRVNPDDSISSIAGAMGGTMGGTDMRVPFQALEKLNYKADRIIVLSDMQSWAQGSWKSPDDTVNDSFNTYKRKYNPECHIYTFDLTGSGTMQFPERNVYAVAGFSEKIFDVMAQMEEDPNALINEIESIQL